MQSSRWLEIGICATATVVLLLELVNVTFEVVVARAHVSKTRGYVGDDVRDIPMPPICDGTDLRVDLIGVNTTLK